MSEFWKRKVRTYFHFIDFNHDGQITKEDFEQIADRFSADTDEERKVIQKLTLQELFTQYKKAAGSDGHITEQSFIDAVKKLRDQPDFLALLRKVSSVIFYFLDIDEDKKISEKELVRFFKNFSIPDPEKSAKTALVDVDTDHDGQVSNAELREAFVNYLTSDDEKASGSTLFGKLVD